MHPIFKIILSQLLITSIGLSCSSKLSTDWRKMDCGLYISPTGDIGFASYPERANIDKSELEAEEIPNYFLSRFNYNDTTQLKYVIDTLTFEQTGPMIYKDKNHDYYYYPNSDGGYFYLLVSED